MVVKNEGMPMDRGAPDLTTLRLQPGAHESRRDGVCLMEAAAWFVDGEHTDHPRCVCSVLAAMGRSLNDRLDDEVRQELVSLIPVVVQTANDGLGLKRGYLALDWLIRTATPAWLRLAGLHDEAATLRALPESLDGASLSSVHQGVQDVRDRVMVAWDTAWDSARGARWDADWIAEREAALAAAGTVERAAWTTAWDTARATAWAGARTAAWDASWDASSEATRAAPWDAVAEAAWYGSWDATWDLVRNAVSDTIRAAARVGAWNPTWESSWKAARRAVEESHWEAVWDGEHDAAWAASWDEATSAAWAAAREAGARAAHDAVNANAREVDRSSVAQFRRMVELSPTA